MYTARCLRCAKLLVIAPVLTYSSHLGGSDDEGILGIQRDLSIGSSPATVVLDALKRVRNQIQPSDQSGRAAQLRLAIDELVRECRMECSQATR